MPRRFDFEIVEAPVVTPRYAARPHPADFAERSRFIEAVSTELTERYEELREHDPYDQLGLAEQKRDRTNLRADLKAIGLGVVAALVVVSAKLLGVL